MTTKYITTYVAAGYTLGAAYSTLDITSTGGVGGTGVTSSHAATVINEGSIVGSTNGVFLSAGGAVINGAAGESAASIHGNVEGGGGRLNVANYALIQGGVGAYNLSLSNLGTITGGISATKGGAVDNGSAYDTAALIGGAVYFSTNGVGHNFGTITGRVVTGEYGAVTNGSVEDVTATIEGGIYTSRNNYRTGSSIVNFGTVDGATSGYRLGGVVMRCDGDSLTNGGRHDDAALIYGSTYGVAMEPYINGYLRNYGSVVGGSEAGVLMTNSGGVINGAGVHSHALIKGVIGIDEVSGSSFGGRVSNFGTVQGGSRRGVGVELDGGGEIANGYLQNHSALIEGYSGVVIKDGFLVDNFGTIRGQGKSAGYGVMLGTGNLTNGAAGYSRNLIEGFTGVEAAGTMQTVTNFGLIAGGAGGAVVFGSATDVLVVENGSKFIGTVEGDGGTLVLDTGTGAVTGLTGEGAIVVRGIMAATTFSSFATLEIGHYANFKLLGDGSVAAGQTVSDAGVLALGTSKKASVDNEGLIETTGTGVLTLHGRITNKGTIAALGGTLVVTGVLSGVGVATIDAATMEFTQATAQSVSFTGTSGMLILAQSQAYTGAISHFSYTGGTSLDLEDIAYVGGKQASYSGTSKAGVLTVTDGTHTARIAFTGNYRASQFVVTSDGRGGVIVVDPTRLATAPDPTPDRAPAAISPTPSSVHRFVAAAAGLVSGAASPLHVGALDTLRAALIAAPKPAMA